ncbi:helix-turn-helix transcriptional regulator [Flavobacterium collinsii]|uniref:helix-turn-helix transcriptional regulator n=1 Tax=Flavobacterium collinsii TaxID=1114861 RepID=UPI0037566DD5
MKEKLLKARLNKGLSQKELADLVGMTQSNYSRRENGLKKISDSEWIRIAKEIGVKKEDIFEPDNSIINFENTNDLKLTKSQSFKIPDFVIDYIKLLHDKIKILEEKLEKK